MTKTNSEWKSDFLPFNHGEEGTHGACNKHLKLYGSKTVCCECAGRTDCSNEETKEKKYTATFLGKRYDQLERLSGKRKSKLYVITKALDLLEKAKNV